MKLGTHAERMAALEEIANSDCGAQMAIYAIAQAHQLELDARREERTEHSYNTSRNNPAALAGAQWQS